MSTDTLHDRAFALVNSESSPPLEGSSDKPFLEVDPEHRYKTPEEAKEAITESSRRVEELSAFEERLKQYGIEHPEQIDAVVDEYRTLLARQEAGSPLSERDQAALKYLESLGMVTKSHLQDAEQQQRAEEARVRDEGIVESARTDLQTLLKDVGLPAESSKYAEPWMKEYIESKSVDSRGRIKPGSLLDRFWQGGQETKKVIQEVLAVWKTGVDQIRVSSQPVAIPSPKKTTTTRGGQPVPVGNPGARTPSSMHDKAWELLQTTPPRRMHGVR